MNCPRTSHAGSSQLPENAWPDKGSPAFCRNVKSRLSTSSDIRYSRFKAVAFAANELVSNCRSRGEKDPMSALARNSLAQRLTRISGQITSLARMLPWSSSMAGHSGVNAHCVSGVNMRRCVVSAPRASSEVLQVALMGFQNLG